MKTKILIVLAAIFIMPIAASAMLNPSAVYCNEMGYTYAVESTLEGDVGKCILPGNYSFDAWSFLQGEVAQAYSYCAKQGYDLKVVEDAALCSGISTSKCAVCVADGREVEVTRLMNLSFQETICGDSHCGFPENYGNCPQDCPSGIIDGYCDGIADGVCDSDCNALNETIKDADCRGAEINYVFIAFAGIIALLAIVLVLIKLLR